METVEEKTLETSQHIVILKNTRFAPNNSAGQDKSSISARRYQTDTGDDSILDRSHQSNKRPPKNFKSITGGDAATMDKSKIVDVSNPDSTEIDFSLTQNLTHMNQTALN